MVDGPSVDKNVSLPRVSTSPTIATADSKPAPLRASTLPAGTLLECLILGIIDLHSAQFAADALPITLHR